MKLEEVVFILDMALHTKHTLTRAESLAIQKANALCAEQLRNWLRKKQLKRVMMRSGSEWLLKH